MAETNEPRVAPVWPPDWDAAVYEVMNQMPHARDNILNTWQPGRPGILGTNLACTQLRHPVLAKALFSFNAHHFYTTTLPARERELVIMRIGWLARAEYEYLAHVGLGLEAGLTQTEIERLREGPDAEGWSSKDAAIIRAVDELHHRSSISDASYEALAQHLDVRQIMDLMAAAGCYLMLGWFLNTLKVQLEPGATPLEPAVRARMGK